MSAPVFVAPREPEWRFVLHLPPALFLVAVGVLAGAVGPWALRSSSGVVDVWLRLGIGARVVGAAALLVASASGWRAPGPWWSRGFSFSVLGLAWVFGGLSLGLGAKMPPWGVDLALGALFAAVPLYLRRARLTEFWMEGSLRPLLWIAATGLSPLVAMGAGGVYRWWLRAEAPAVIESLDLVTKELRVLGSTGALSRDAQDALVTRLQGLPAPEHLWLLAAASPPEEAKERQGPVEKSLTQMLDGASVLFLAQRERAAARGPWELTTGPLSTLNKAHFARAASYWEAVERVTIDGAIFSLALTESDPHGLAPNTKLRPAPEDTLGRLSRLRGDAAVAAGRIAPSLSGGNREATQLAEYQAARVALSPYPGLLALLPPVGLDLRQVEGWGALTLLDAPLLAAWSQLAQTDPERLVTEARCFRGKALDLAGKKGLRSFSCPVYDLGQEVERALVVRASVLFPSGAGPAEQFWLEVPKPKDIPGWKREFLAALEAQGVTVQQESAGFRLVSDEKDATPRPPLALQFVEDGGRIQARISRASTKKK